MNDFDVTAERAFDGNDQPAILLKFSSPVVEVNVFVPGSAADALRGFLAGELGRIKIGKSANSDVHWVREDGDVYMLIGEDAQSWDIGLTLGEKVLSSLWQEMVRFHQSGR